MNKILTILFIVISISSNAQWYGLNQNVGGDDACQFDISTAVYDDISFDVSTQDAIPRVVEFKPDGSIMYITGASTDSAYQYDLSTNFDITTAVYNGVSFYLNPQDANPATIRFKPDGTKMYYLGTSTDNAYQYTLSTPWDISTATYDSKTVDLKSRNSNAGDIFFKDDGLKMYYSGQVGFNDSIYQYTLSTAWDISTATYDDIVKGLDSGGGNVGGIYITSSGTQLFALIVSPAIILQYTLSTPWDISSLSYDSVSLSVSSQETISQNIYFRADCSNFFMIGSTNGSAHRYSY